MPQIKLKKIKRAGENTGRINRSEKMIRAGLAVCCAFLVLTGSACVVSPSLTKQPPPTPPENKMTDLERDILSMETADFEYIFIFRRKDGGKFDSDDKKYLKENSPPETNRFVISDDDKAVIAGSSFPFEPKTLEILGERFNIETHPVKPEENKQ